ncbi:hypothetical protein DL98DRAFT_589441 [Cadophora sp. DSE1049]|nr:hypothetical protein DL98DRAFT_589441 [Cadophora sp. DSE1049]
MCKLVQTNVYHYCCHKQKVDVPSTNPNCKTELVGYEYLMNEWCPRCRIRWLGIIVPFEYEELAGGVPCGGYRGKVKRRVILRPEDFRPLTKEQIWAGRDHYLRDEMGEFRKSQQIEMYNRSRDHEDAENVSNVDRTYFMEASNDEDKSYNRCPELFHPLESDEIPESEIECSYCKVPWIIEDGERPHLSHEAVLLPCGHIFGQECISGWMGHHQIPTCPACSRRYKIIHEITDEDWERWLPDGYAEQKMVDFALDSDIHRLKVSLIHSYHLKLLLVAILFAPPPFTSWVNLFMLTFGAALFWSSFIHLPTAAPNLSPRERIIQNRFVVCSAMGNTIELSIARFTGAGRYSLLAYPCLSWLALEFLRKVLPQMGWDFALDLFLPDSRLPSPFDRPYVVLGPEGDGIDEEAVEEELWEEELVDEGAEDEEPVERY